MFAKLTGKKKSRKSADAREAKEEEKNFKVFGTDKITNMMKKRMKQVANIEYINATKFMRKNNEGFLAVDDLIVYENNKLQKSRDNRPPPPRRSLPPSEAPFEIGRKSRKAMDGPSAQHEEVTLPCECMVCKQ